MSRANDMAYAADRVLIEAAKSDPAAFEGIYNRYFEPVFHFVFQRIADTEISRDITQLVFLKAINKLASYNEKGVPYLAYLYRIASNAVTDHYRRTQTQRAVCIDSPQLKKLAAETNENQYTELIPALKELLDNLPEAELQLIEMRFFEDRPYAEIGLIMGITENNAKVKLYRLLDKLKAIMHAKKLTPCL
jgi:RNA polymerase sigma-70 factor, ECF subfamily